MYAISQSVLAVRGCPGNEYTKHAACCSVNSHMLCMLLTRLKECPKRPIKKTWHFCVLKKLGLVKVEVCTDQAKQH